MSRLLIATAVAAGLTISSAPLWVCTTAFAQDNVPPKAGVSQPPSSTPAPAVAGQGESPGQAQPTGAPPQQSPLPTLIMFGVIFLIFWLFIIRPQSKKAKEHQDMVKALQKGDQVVTQSGILGRISGFDDEAGAVIVEIAKDTRIRILRGQIGGLQPKKEQEAKS